MFLALCLSPLVSMVVCIRPVSLGTHRPRYCRVSGSTFQIIIPKDPPGNRALLCMQSKSWGIGFAIPAVAMVGAVVIFMSGHKCYTHIKPTGSPLERAFDLSWHAILHWLRNPCGSSQADAAAVPRPVDVRF